MEEITPEVVSIQIEKSSLNIKDSDAEKGQNNFKFILSTKKKIILSLIILALISSGVILFVLLFKKGETKVQDYKETKYELLVRSNITSLTGSKPSTIHDDFRVIFFALDMKGDRYRILLTRGVVEGGPSNTTSTEAKPDYFIYLELDSRTGKVLEARYKKEVFDDASINLLIGITQVFVVDQDSEWEYSSHCKKTTSQGNQCTRNSKKQEGTSVLFKRQENNQDRKDPDADFEHTSKTWVDSDGKVEKSRVDGWFSKVVDDKRKEVISFNLSASVDVLSVSKIPKQDLDELNQIVEDLPLANQTAGSKKRFEADDFIEEKTLQDDDEEEDDLPILKETTKPNSPSNHGRKLFQESLDYNYFQFYLIPFYLSSDLYSEYDEDNRAWFCGIHRFEFGGINLGLLKKDFCLTSHGAIPQKKKKIKKWVQEGSQKIYLYRETFSIFTIDLYSKVKVKNTPYVETFLNSNGNTVTNVVVETKITVSITGQASVILAKVGVTFGNSMISNINDYMVGYQSPFTAWVSTDKSLEGFFEIWIKYLTIELKCWSFLGIKICLPYIGYSDKKTLFDESFEYAYFPREWIFEKAFD